MQEILKLKEEVTKFLLDKFSIAPEKTSLTIYTPEHWSKYLEKNRFSPTQFGTYSAGDHSAHILYSPRISNVLLFHEYFGHGTYFEHTKAGQLLHHLKNELNQEEKEANIKTIEEKTEFRAENQTAQKIEDHVKETINTCEGFATWMEWYLSKLTGHEAIFYRLLPKNSPYERILNKFAEYQLQYGEYAILYECGLPKHYNTEILTNILLKIFPTNYKSIDFAVNYGSKKPDSDIDIFLVSDKIQGINNHWLDISSINREHFERLVSKLDISVTDPLFTGEFICGSRNKFKKTKKRILETPITQEMIDHHIAHVKVAKEIGLNLEEGTKNRQTALRYNKSYLLNAKELEQGRKPLTLKEIVKRYPEEFTCRNKQEPADATAQPTPCSCLSKQ